MQRIDEIVPPVFRSLGFFLVARSTSVAIWLFLLPNRGVTFPVAWNSPIFCFGRSFADRHHVADLAMVVRFLCVMSRTAHGSADGGRGAMQSGGDGAHRLAGNQCSRNTLPLLNLSEWARHS